MAKVTRNQEQGLEGLPADLGHCMSFLQAVEEHDKTSRGRPGANAELGPGSSCEEPDTASASDQQPAAESQVGLRRSRSDPCGQIL